MLDPTDYQNTSGVSSGVTNYMNGIGGQQTDAGSTGGGWMQQAGSWLGSDSMGQGMGISGMNNGQMILAADQMGGQLFGMLAGQNESTAGNIIKNIPGLSTIGNFINAAFGSHINDEFVNQTNYGINFLGSRKFNSKTNADVLNDWKASSLMSHVSKSEVGSDGWFSNKAKNKTNALNEGIDEANMKQLMNLGIAAGNADQNTDRRILQGMAAYGGPINSFRKYYSKGGYLSQAKALIRQNEGWREKPYADAPKGKNWRSVGYGFNDSGFREKYPEGISKHYEHGITKKQAEEELNYFLNKAEKNLKSIYGKQWNDFTDSQKAAILDTYYQRPASVGKGSRFYKAVTAGEDAGKYLGVAGFSKRNKIRQGVFGGSQDYVNLGAETENLNPNSSTLQEVTPFTPVVHDLDLSGIIPTQAKALELNLASPTFDLSMFGSTQTPQESKVPTVGTVEDFLASYGDFGENLFKQGGRLFEGGGSTNGWMDFFKAWGASQGGGNNYFSNMGGNQWKPSSGIQKNTSNGSVQDWLGVAGSAVNTISNWGKEDPSLGRGGGYSDFGMAAYDVMKIIRDATKDRKESMDKKLGIPIYARGGRLFEGGGSMGAMGYAQIGLSALKLASNAKHQASLDDDIDRGTIDRSINRYGQEFDDAVANVNTNGDLLDLWQNNSTIEPNLTMRDFRDKSYFDDFLNGYAASWEGFNAGAQTGNPYVTAIAAVVGGASSNIASIIGRNKAEDAARETNIKIRKANERRMDSLLAAADRVDRENDYRILQNMGANGGKLSMGFGLRNPFVMPDGTANPLYKAFGGALAHEMDWDTGINWVNEGGSHGENPLGGVPMGVDEQGIPNLVEEGEAIWNGDYVFSKRMKVPKKLREKYSLPDDATFADAVAKLTKNSDERPLSSIDRNTQDHILGEFADTQEEMRMAKAQRAMEKQQQLRDDFLMGMQFGLGGHMSPVGIIPNSDNVSLFDKLENSFADGGGIHIDPSKKGTFKAQASKMGMGVQEAASHILAHKKDYSPEIVKKAVFAHNFAHAFGGSLFGDGGDLFGEPSFYDANVFDNGGPIKAMQEKLRGQGLSDDLIDEWIYKNKPEWKIEYFNKHRLTNNWRAYPMIARPTDETAPVDWTDGSLWNTVKEPEEPALTKSPFKPKQTWTRYAPMVMSGLMGLKEMLTPADYTNADAVMTAAYQAGKPVSVGTEYIGDYRKRDPFDERYLMNIINQRGNATNRNMMNLSGGNRAVAMSGILANDLTTQMSLAEAARQAYLANRTDDADVAAFNKDTNKFNATAQNTRNLSLAQLNSGRQSAMLSGIAQGARLRQAIKDQRDAAIAANLSAFAQGLGDIGWENYQTNQANSLYAQGYTPYWLSGSGKTEFK